MRDGETAYGRYILEDRIAMGGMAEIFRARTNTEGFQKQICIKRILPNFLNEPGFETMFRDEAALAARLQHANIVQVFDFGEVDGTLFLAMELVDGIDLKQLLERSVQARHQPSISQCCQVTVDICRGLHFAHNAQIAGRRLGVVHRDVSPHNILISRSGEIKVADFGIAKAAERSTHTATGLIKGKIAYMAPEQAAGSKLDHRVDQFSTGIILWEMLTGQKLFAGKGQAQTLMAVLEANIPIPSHLRPEIPKELDEIVLKALSKDPENRFSNMRTFQQSLGRFIHSLPPEINDDDVVSWVEAVFEGEKSFERQTQIRNSDKTPNTKTADLVFEDTNQVPPHAPTAVKQSVISSAEASSVTLQGAPMVVTANDDTPPTSSRKIGRAAFMGIVGISMVGLVMQQLGPFEREQHSGESRTADSRETHPKPLIKKAATKQNVVPKIPVAADEKKITIPTVKKRASLKRKKMIKGTVLVDVLNSWAEVWLGTKNLGETPLKVSLPVGRYELILKNPETKKQKVIETTLKAEGNKALRIQF